MVLAYNQFVIRCTNLNCEYFGETRIASMPMVTHGAYVAPSQIMCQCGMHPEIEKEI